MQKMQEKGWISKIDIFVNFITFFQVLLDAQSII